VTAAPLASRREAVFPHGIRHRTPFPFMRSLRADALAAVGRALAKHGDAVGIQGGPIDVVVPARLLQHFQVETDPARPVVTRPQLTHEAACGVRLRLESRIQP
jgi:hypothetical protein